MLYSHELHGNVQWLVMKCPGLPSNYTPSFTHTRTHPHPHTHTHTRAADNYTHTYTQYARVNAAQRAHTHPHTPTHAHTLRSCERSTHRTQ